MVTHIALKAFAYFVLIVVYVKLVISWYDSVFKGNYLHNASFITGAIFAVLPLVGLVVLIFLMRQIRKIKP